MVTQYKSTFGTQNFETVPLASSVYRSHCNNTHFFEFLVLLVGPVDLRAALGLVLDNELIVDSPELKV